MRPPKLEWQGSHAGKYMVQSEIVRGEPRVYYAVQLAGGKWEGPSRRTEKAAMIDAEYHSAGRLEERPLCFAYSI